MLHLDHAKITTVEPAAPTSVVIVEEEATFRERLQNALSGFPRVQVVGSFPDGESALRGIPALNPRIAVVDGALRGPLRGVELGVKLRRVMPNLGIVLLAEQECAGEALALPPASSSTGDGWACLRNGSVANFDLLRRALEAADSGLIAIDARLVPVRRHPPSGPLAHLTPRQWDVLELIAGGLTNAAIAERLFVTEKSVENHINVLYQQLDIDRSDTTVQPRVTAALLYWRSQR